MPACSALSSSCRRLASAAAIALILGFGGPAHAALLTVSWLDQDDSSDPANPNLLVRSPMGNFKLGTTEVVFIEAKGGFFVYRWPQSKADVLLKRLRQRETM